MNHFQQRLKSAMDLRKITQTELSKRTGITKASISQYVNGIYKANQKNLFLLAQALNCTPDYLVGLVDEPEDEMENPFDVGELSPDEELLVTIFRHLDDSDQEYAIIFMDDLSRSAELKHLPDTEVINIPEDEKNLVSDYRKLNVVGKEKAKEYIGDLTENEKYTL